MHESTDAFSVLRATISIADAGPRPLFPADSKRLQYTQTELNSKRWYRSKDILPLRYLPREATRSAVLPRQVVCLSVSVTLRYRDHIGWNSWKIISRLINLSSEPFRSHCMDVLHIAKKRKSTAYNKSKSLANASTVNVQRNYVHECVVPIYHRHAA